MIILLLGIANEYIVPRRQKMDNIDNFLLWTIKICLVILFVTLPIALAKEMPDDNHWLSCSGGDVEALEEALLQNPGKLMLLTIPYSNVVFVDFKTKKSRLTNYNSSVYSFFLLLRSIEWIHTTTENGESCLHLAGIYGHSDVTSLLLKKGADPNVRSNWEDGLRMHPLSWNVYGGHLENVRLLLENGADVNADFDSMDKKQPVTITDIALQLANVEGNEKFEKMVSLLKNYGGKTMREIQESSESEL